jgi:hypothetical protein
MGRHTTAMEELELRHTCLREGYAQEELKSRVSQIKIKQLKIRVGLRNN